MVLRCFAVALGAVAAFGACSSSTASPTAPPADVDASSSTPEGPMEPLEAGVDAAPSASAPTLPGCPQDPGPPAIDVKATSATDPVGGAEKFTIAEALAGYPAAAGVLTALITTEKSTIRCELDELAAPISVANFVGLARGTRPFKKAGKWKVGRFYDGLLWHRVIPNFVIQGGDPLGTGTGGPGYDLVEENHVVEPLGTLAMAASATPSGSQFFVVVGKGPQPEYNVFGSCATETAIAIAAEPRDKQDRPTTDVHMQRIDIARCPK